MPMQRPEWMAGLPAHYGMDWTCHYQNTADGALEITPGSLPTPFVVAVTGSGRGIGAEIARSYARAGASGMMLTSRTIADLVDVAASIKEINPNINVAYCACDVAQQSQLVTLASQIEQQFGRLDVAVINAGITPELVHDAKGGTHSPLGILEDTSEEFFRVCDGNFRAAYLSSRVLLPLLRQTARGAGAMVFVSSACSLFHTTDMAPFSFSLSKLATNRLAEVIHESYHREGISAYAIHPGGIATPGNGDFPASIRARLTDDISLPGGMCVWLTKERRDWLSGRYICANWDVRELQACKKEIVEGDKFKLRLVI